MAGITESRQSIGQYFTEKRIPTCRLLHPTRELEDALSDWVRNEGAPDAPLGNLKPILEIMRLRPFHISEVEGYLAGIYTDPRSKTCFAPFPLTVATWLIHSMVVRSWNQESEDRGWKETEINKVLRHKIRVIRDSFLWMKDLSGSMGNWEWNLFPPSDVNTDRKSERAIQENLLWLQGGEVKKFYNKRSDQVDQSRINELWEMFVKNKNLAVKCAFCLAQMGAKGSWDAEEKVNIQSNWVPQEWFEYYQVISILLVCGDRSR